MTPALINNLSADVAPSPAVPSQTPLHGPQYFKSYARNCLHLASLVPVPPCFFPLQNLSYTLLPVPPGKGGLTYDVQAALWREYLQTEGNNTQQVAGDTHRARMHLAFKQCLLSFYAYPEVSMHTARYSLANM